VLSPEELEEAKRECDKVGYSCLALTDLQGRGAFEK
jgi:nitrogen regulatory protein PII|tara:strand:+ start:326 stop:433 length:108 start_codon:yes stop_codon:yes gene_type:complete